MLRISLLSILLLSTLSLSAQEIYNTYFQGVHTIICSPDSAPTLQILPQGWTIYQTTDGNWDGPVDPTRCISSQPQPNGYGVRIDLGQIDPAEPLFIRATADELASNSNPFIPNALYTLSICSEVDNNIQDQVLTGSNCAQDLCSGAFLGIAIPDSNGVPGGATRFQTSLVNQEELSYCFESCFPSEYFEDQQLRELILTFSFLPTANLTNRSLYVYNVGVALVTEEPGYLTQIVASPQHFANGEYTLNVSETVDNSPWFIQHVVALHDPSTYPDDQHETYIEARPEPNTVEPQTINLLVEPYQTLEIQPFANLRGGLTLGSDSLRHTLNLVNNGGDMCLNFADLIFGGEDEYRHGGGTISMNNGFSCMQFHDNSALRVKEGATLHYGDNGTGMLLLCAGSTIVLEHNATLYFDGRLILSECNDDGLPQQIYMDLPPGARLIFTEKAHVTNQFSHNQQMHLNVRMLGGTLEDAALAPSDRPIIKQIWPNPAAHLADNITISPNPFSTTVNLEYLSAAEEDIQLVWTNLNGQIVGTEHLQAVRGPNTWQPKVPNAAGMYLATFQGQAGKCTKKVVRIDP